MFIKKDIIKIQKDAITLKSDIVKAKRLMRLKRKERKR